MRNQTTSRSFNIPTSFGGQKGEDECSNLETSTSWALISFSYPDRWREKSKWEVILALLHPIPLIDLALHFLLRSRDRGKDWAEGMWAKYWGVGLFWWGVVKFFDGVVLLFCRSLVSRRYIVDTNDWRWGKGDFCESSISKVPRTRYPMCVFWISTFMAGPSSRAIDWNNVFWTSMDNLVYLCLDLGLSTYLPADIGINRK